MKLNNIFSSNMVFAANKPIKVYGEGKGKAVISFAGQKKEVLSENDAWLIEFPPMSYGGPYTLGFATETEDITFDDIYIGEVFLMAGQSNMQFKMGDSTTMKIEYKDEPRLRLFSTQNIEDSDVFKPWDGWKKCIAQEIDNWSALVYLSAIEYLKLHDVHIGIITCYQGASIIESWVPEQAFQKVGLPLSVLDKHPNVKKSEYSAWNDEGRLYNHTLSQAIPFELTGVVWYQGESDSVAIESEIYKEELRELIRIWRNDFNDKNLPFVIVQLADYDLRDNEYWHGVQKAQYEIQFEINNAKTVISSDISETNDIHPPTKDKLAIRIADALNKLLH